MQPKSKKGTRTRLKLIQTAVELFHKNGLRGTSVDDILSRSKTGKSQFYHYFTSKDDLIHEVLAYYLDLIEAPGGLAHRKIESWEDLGKWFEFFLNAQDAFHCRRGCPIGSIANELTGEQEKIREDIEHIFRVTQSQVTGFFCRLEDSGAHPTSQTPESMANFCIAVLQGAILMAKVHGHITPARDIVEQAIKYLKLNFREYSYS